MAKNALAAFMAAVASSEKAAGIKDSQESRRRVIFGEKKKVNCWNA